MQKLPIETVSISDDMEKYYFDCCCHSMEHLLRFTVIKDDDEKFPWSELFVEIHLSPEVNVFKRIWYAIKYIFGHKSEYGWGCFGSWELHWDDIERLQKLLDYFRNLIATCRKKRKVYIICPVRKATPEITTQIQDYVTELENQGCEVHFPPRDVEQDDPSGGYNICMAHRKAMLESNEVHIFWDRESTGSHFDFGMAFALGKKIKLVKLFGADTNGKSYLKVIRRLDAERKDLP
jgi:hypothetical protein